MAEEFKEESFEPPEDIIFINGERFTEIRDAFANNKEMENAIKSFFGIAEGTIRWEDNGEGTWKAAPQTKPHPETQENIETNGPEMSLEKLYDRARSLVQNKDGCQCETCVKDRKRFLNWVEDRYFESQKCVIDEDAERPWNTSNGHRFEWGDWGEWKTH